MGLEMFLEILTAIWTTEIGLLLMAPIHLSKDDTIIVRNFLEPAEVNPYLCCMLQNWNAYFAK